jgi:hypothetical protein
MCSRPDYDRTTAIAPEHIHYRTLASCPELGRLFAAEAHVPSDPPHDCHSGSAKGSVKDVQGLLRHSRAATTTHVYMQEILKACKQPSARFTKN